MPEIIVVGKGPAGISAALYAARAGVHVTVVAKDGGALLRTEKIENYYGFPRPIKGEDLIQNGVAQAKRLGVQFVEDEVVHIGFEEQLLIQTAHQAMAADALILATGTARQLPKIKGIKKYEGKGVSHCAICDAFFYRGKDVAVLGSGEFALHEINDLLPVVNSVTLFTHGEPLQVSLPQVVRVEEMPITELVGRNTLEAVRLADGSELQVAGFFVAVGVAGSTALAYKIGAAVEGTHIVVDDNMRTTIPGLFAAGDCTGGLLQIAKAVYDGAKAGMAAAQYVRKARAQQP